MFDDARAFRHSRVSRKYLVNGTIFGKNILHEIYTFIIITTLLEASAPPFSRRIRRYTTVVKVLTYLCKVPDTFVEF